MDFCRKIHGKRSGRKGNDMKNKSFNDVFSKNLRYYFDLSGMTQAEFAKKLGVGTTSIYNWLSGVKTPRMDKVDSMCKLLGVHRENLITDNMASEEEIATFAGDTFKKQRDSVFAKLDEKEWDLLEIIAEYIVNSKKPEE